MREQDRLPRRTPIYAQRENNTVDCVESCVQVLLVSRFPSDAILKRFDPAIAGLEGGFQMLATK